MKPINVGICGATGYSGLELIKILERHPFVNIKFFTSESSAGKPVRDITPELVDFHKEKYLSMEDEAIYDDVDVVFFCLPHEPAAVSAKNFIDNDIKVIDLSAAYRIKDTAVFEDYYSFEHPYPDLIKDAVYGLTEIYADKIKEAKLIANPGCYPTSVLIPLIPLLKEKIIEPDTIIVDAKSGFSGRGKKMDRDGLFVEMNQNMYAYGVAKHRHTPEMIQELESAYGSVIPLMFTPQVIPVDRGIYSNIYLKTDEKKRREALDFLEEYYGKNLFIKTLPDNLPRLKWVAHTNQVHIGAEYNPDAGYLVIVSAIDNLIKGASGQAVQNMNLMCGFAETEGLT